MRVNLQTLGKSTVFCAVAAASFLIAHDVLARNGSYPNFTFSPTEQQILCAGKAPITSCPEGATSKSVDANVVEDDANFNSQYMANNGCTSEGTNVGCTSYFGTPSTISICCKSSSKSTTNACLSEPASECGNSSTDGNEADSFSYKCLSSGACGLYTGAKPAPIGGTGASRPCANSDDVCCQIPRCPKAKTPTSTAAKPPAEYKLINPLGTTSIPVILGRIIKTFLGIVGALALAAFVYGGLMWMTARGDASQVKKGQDALKNASIGLFLVMFAYTLAGSIVTFLTSEQKTIATEEGRGVTEEEPTVKGGDVQTVQGQLNEAEKKTEEGQAAAKEAGQEAGVSTLAGLSGCDAPYLSEQEIADCKEKTIYTYCESNFPDITGKGYTDCVADLKSQSSGWQGQGAISEWLGTGQSTYNTPNYQAGQTGGQQDCKYANDPDKCSTIGWKTVCNQKVFDTGYGTYNDIACRNPQDCQPGTVLSNDCNEVAKIVAGIPGLQNVGCNASSNSLVGLGKECQKMNTLCCKPKP